MVIIKLINININISINILSHSLILFYSLFLISSIRIFIAESHSSSTVSND